MMRKYKAKLEKSKIQYSIPNLRVLDEAESCERYEAISFYKDNIKLTIDVKVAFHERVRYPLKMVLKFMHALRYTLEYVGYILVQNKMIFKHI